MTTEVVQIATPASPAQPVDETAEVVPFGAHTSELVLWAYEARQAAQIAKSLAKTSFVPLSLRGKPEDITAAILAGSELGMKPMATLRSIDVIQGTPALRAHAMRALLQSHGHQVLLVESTNERCLMRGRRKGEDEWQESEWDLARAGVLGLLGKAEWKKQPKTMLIARATGEICRLVASDVLHAMPYNAEELRDSESEEAGSGRSLRVTAAEIIAASGPPLKSAEVAAPAAVLTEAAVPSESPAPVGPTPVQREAIAALFAAVDLPGADDRARYVSEVIGRPVASLDDPTPTETANLTDALRRFAAQSEPRDDEAGA